MTTVTVFFQDIFMKYSKETLMHTFQDELKDPVTAQVRRDNINIVAFNEATKHGEGKKERW
jgi:hypothetical protein